MKIDDITGGSYSPDKCSLVFFNFEAEDSGDWKVKASYSEGVLTLYAKLRGTGVPFFPLSHLIPLRYLLKF